METADLPINIASWALALLPIVVLLVLLVVLRWKAPQAGAVGMFAAAAVALFALQTPWETLAGAGAKGVFVLFSHLQQSVARLNELPEATIIAAQSAGGAIGNAIAPANVVLGASTAGGEILRKNSLDDWSGTLGHAQAVRIHPEGGFLEGGADPRGDGAAAGW